MSAPGIDWPALLRAGLSGLRLKPDEFWALSPVELALMLGVGARPAPMGRDGFLALARAFPDEELPR